MQRREAYGLAGRERRVSLRFVSDLRFEAGDFVRRWWKVLLPVAVLAIAIPVALVVSGGDDDGDVGNTVALESPAAPDQGTPPSSDAPTSSPSGQNAGGGNKGEGGAGQDGGSGSGSANAGTDGAANEAPPSPFGPPGHPVGEVPPGSPPSADEQAVSGTLTNFLRAISRGDGPQACAQLSPEGRERVEKEVHSAAPETQGTPCEGAIVLYQGGYGASARHPTITDVQVAGDQATATGPPGKRRGDLAKYDNVWLIDNYGWG